jgi:hypothetical protein
MPYGTTSIACSATSGPPEVGINVGTATTRSLYTDFNFSVQILEANTLVRIDQT